MGRRMIGVGAKGAEGAKVVESPPKVGYPVGLIWVTVGSL